MRETEKTETEREIVVNMDHMSMLEFGHLFFIFNLPVFPFSLPFVSSLIIACNTLLCT